jgi:uncharacterized protein YoxC
MELTVEQQQALRDGTLSRREVLQRFPDDFPFSGVSECREEMQGDVEDPGTFCAEWAREAKGEEPAAMQAVHNLAEVQDPDAIERVTQSDGSVRYTDILLLAPGVWGDAGSGQHIFYSPRGIENSADNWTDTTVNLFHERDNEVTDVGDVDEGAVYLDDECNLYGDIVLHRDNPASEFADEALQNALDTNGREGLQGPSVELQGDRYRYNESRDVRELLEGTFNGLGLVGLGVSPGPASEDAAFAEQTRERAVALASDESPAVVTPQPTAQIMHRDHIVSQLAELGIDVDDDVDDEALAMLAETTDIDTTPDEGRSDDTDEPEADADGSDETDADVDEDALTVDDLAEQVTALQETVDELTALQGLQDDLQSLQATVDDLAGLDETVQTLQEETEPLRGEADLVTEERLNDLEQRVDEIASEPEDEQSLMELQEYHGASDDSSIEPDEWGPATLSRPSYTEH